MHSATIKLSAVIFIMILIVTVSNANELTEPLKGPLSNEEALHTRHEEELPDEIHRLEQLHKEASERNDLKEAESIAGRINQLMPPGRVTKSIKDNAQEIFIDKAPEEMEGEWLQQNNSVYNGLLGRAEGYHRIVDMKTGEDGNLYLAAIWKNANYPTGLVSYRSTNNGLSWQYIYGVYISSTYIGNISLLVESRNNNVADSTRLIIFYNKSSSNNMDNASLSFASWRVNGTGYYSGSIALPSSGNEMSHISAVSDGAFYQGATYFGAIFTETTNDLKNKVKMHYCRTMDWGATWTSVAIQTNFNDFCPSADLRRGSPDSLYVIMERRFDSTNYSLRLLSIPFSPSSSYFTYFLAGSNGMKYRNPCITIKQNTPVDSMMITCTRNYRVVLFSSSAPGFSQSYEFEMPGSSSYYAGYVHCSSSPQGNRPFSVAWSTYDGDTISSAAGTNGSLHNFIKTKVNSSNCFASAMPVCANFSGNGVGFTATVYPGAQSQTVPQNIYSNQQGIGILNVKLMPEALYNPATDMLNRADTVTAILRKPVSPYEPIDTAKAVISISDFNCRFVFSKIVYGSLLISVRHRNTLETWSNSAHPITFTGNDSDSFSFVISQGYAHGYNQVKVRNSPARYAFYSGDVNQDGTVDGSDLSLIDNAASNFLSGYVKEDITGDDFVDATDFSFADNNAAKFVTSVIP